MNTTKTEAKTEDLVAETSFNLEFLKNDEDWDELNDFDYGDWDLNFNKQSQDVNTIHHKIEENQGNFKRRAQNYNEIGESSNFPSFSDIQKSLEIVRRAFPQTFTDKVIDSLFSNLMQKMSNLSRKIPSPLIHPKQTTFKPVEHPYSLKNAGNSQRSVSFKKMKKSDVVMHPQAQRRTSKGKQRNLIPGIQQVPLSIHHHPKMKQASNPHKGIAQRLDKIWTQQFQSTLLNLYMKGHQFSLIRDHFQQEYPQHQQCFTVNSLRGRFYKVIRQTVRKLYVSIEKLGREQFPRMMRLDYNTIQNIMYCQQGRNLRCLFIDLYFTQKINKNAIDRIIQTLHQFIIQIKPQGEKKSRAN